jgi:hypothetical protein
MATAPEARLITVRYNGGSVRAPKANLDKLLGDTDAALEARGWGPDPGARRPYGYRRKTNAAAGIPLKVTFADGETWTYRVTGPVKRFVNRIVRRDLGDEVVSIVTPRGAETGRELLGDLDP